jgi:hypothetical protein
MELLNPGDYSIDKKHGILYTFSSLGPTAEVKVKVNYKNLALVNYPNVHFVGDALSARGITVSGAQAIYVTEYLLEK